jgi:tRNA dimethylallyltransferase
MNQGASPGSRLLVLLGPTGTGKSELALELARELGGEIVGCDSVQLYRGLDAATAKPDPRARRAVPHHLVDCVDPRTDCSMADYVRAADAAIAELVSRGRVPLVVGGTGLYLRGLLRGVLEAPARDPKLRGRLQKIIERGGTDRLRRVLRRRDGESERRIPEADVQRLVRAVELAMTEGESWSERIRSEGTWSAGTERYRTLKIGLELAAEVHRERLDRRVTRFFEDGLVAEVRELLEAGVPTGANALKAIGYREVLSALDLGEDPSGVVEQVRRNTWRYAKRQRTWFRSEPGVIWLDVARGTGRLVPRVLDLWRQERAEHEI